MSRPEAPRRSRSGIGREVASGLELVARDWAGRIALFLGLVLVLVAALRAEAGTGPRIAGVVVGAGVAAAVVAGWWRRAPGVVQWSVAVVGTVLTVALSVVVSRA